MELPNLFTYETLKKIQLLCFSKNTLLHYKDCDSFFPSFKTIDFIHDIKTLQEKRIMSDFDGIQAEHLSGSHCQENKTHLFDE